MKIKLYEEYHINWSEINRSEYDTMCGKILSITDERRKKIKSLFDNHHISYIDKKHSYVDDDYPLMISLIFYINYDKIIISECNDEWFLIRHVTQILDKDENYDYYNNYYKCDQWDGFLGCLNKILTTYVSFI